MKRMTAWTLSVLFLFLSGTALFAFAEEDGAGVAVKAKAAVLMDAETGAVLFSQKMHEKLYPASVTKVMTLLLVMEALENGTLSLTDTVTASADAAAKGGSQIWLKEGESMTVDELLKATVIGSANDACCALAEKLAGSETAFVAKMNERASALGMNDTHFSNCTGLDDDTTDHLTSAYDVAVMSRALLSHEQIKHYSTVWMDSLRGGETELVNTNKLVRFYEGTTGLKTGTTSKAGCCISASAARDGLHLIAVILGAENSSDRFEGAKTLLNWGFATFETIRPTVDPLLLADVTVRGGTIERVAPVPKAVPLLTIQKTMKGLLTPVVTLPVDVEAPVEDGQILGRIDFVADGKTLASCDLVAQSPVRKRTLKDALRWALASLTRRAA